MASRHERSLFHRVHLDSFKAWLDREKIQHRPGKGEWQVLQVNHPRWKWMVIHESSRAEHLTIDSRMGSMVARFLRDYKSKARARREDGVQVAVITCGDMPELIGEPFEIADMLENIIGDQVGVPDDTVITITFKKITETEYEALPEWEP
jgi:hypothetical protein